jgi:hypothetical protein
MMDACRSAWGKPERMLEALRTAVADLERVVAEEAQSAPASIAALYKLRQAVSDTSAYFDVDRMSSSTRVRELGTELAQRLLVNFKEAEHADSYLVRGIVLVTDRDGYWETRYPDCEVPLGVEEPGIELLLNIPSAFRLFVSNGEWAPAYEIAKSRQQAFTTSGLRGWRNVTIGNSCPKEAARSFDQAADAFEEDVLPSDDDLATRGGHWSGANQLLWSKYYRARALVIQSIESPARMKGLLEKASETLRGTEAGWHSVEVSKFRVLISVLRQIVSEPSSIDKDAAIQEYQLQIRIAGKTDQDQSALTFIADVTDAFAGFARDPHGEFTRNRLDRALRALENIPSIGPEFVEAVRPEIGKKALDAVLGPYRTWMHKSLGAIKDEGRLRRILLRLLQSGLPHYAQIRHGPLEHGKDVVALIDVDGVNVLRMYQVKCGDIDKKKWRESKDEMEEMFEVPLETFQFPAKPERREGILVTNGHANLYAEPAIEGWLRVQREKNNREVEFMNLDALVDWIVTQRLVNELRMALADEGINISHA